MSHPNFVLWKWDQPNFRTVYRAENVNSMVWQLMRMGVPFDRIVCITDNPDGVQCRTFPLWTDYSALKNISGPHLPSCYRRLRIFDPKTLEDIGFKAGERVVSVDIDAVLIQKFVELFKRDEDFVGWYVPGHRHRVVLNGSMFMFSAGQMSWLWETFDPRTSPMKACAAGYMGSDQGYLSHRLLGKQDTGFTIGGWTSIEHGVLSFVRDVKMTRRLPRTTRCVFFAGKRKPWDPAVIKENSWIERYIQPRPPMPIVPNTPVIEAQAVPA